jgi:hypothetical protein
MDPNSISIALITEKSFPGGNWLQSDAELQSPSENGNRRDSFQQI